MEEKYKKALNEIMIIGDYNHWLDCMCRNNIKCKLCKIRDIAKSILKE